MDIYLVNLDRRPDRLKSFFTHSNFPPEWENKIIREPAVDGIKLPEARLKPGEIGCFMSHVKLWQRVCDNERPALVLEDDTIFSANFLHRFQETVLPALPEIVSEGAVLYVGGRDSPEFVTKRRFTEPWLGEQLVRFLRPFETGGGAVLAGNSYVDRTTHAYLITPTAAKGLLAAFHRLGPAVGWTTPVDKFLRQTHLISPSSVLLTCCPLLCYSPLSDDSDCQL